MARYFPLELPTALQAVQSDLLTIEYAREGLWATFATEVAGQHLEVWFPSILVFRVLDEVWLSTEGDVGGDGHRPNHLAYRMEDSVFGASQSRLIRELNPEAREYLFVTGGGCLNVISEAEPTFVVVVHQG
ncbi:hypothetical protein ACO2Q1_04915 [Brevundimonas sp. VNH65]|uniref:hypothetical protein n=1 Tax=Brevundimonas sp. VNH65 TaxID=3400917 RepID=UPI003BFFF3E5